MKILKWLLYVFIGLLALIGFISLVNDAVHYFRHDGPFKVSISDADQS